MDCLMLLPKVVLIFVLVIRSGPGIWIPQLIQEDTGE